MKIIDYSAWGHAYWEHIKMPNLRIGDIKQAKLIPLYTTSVLNIDIHFF